MAKAKELNILFVETSAKIDVGINELFENILQTLVGDDEMEDGDQEGQSHPAPNPNGIFFTFNLKRETSISMTSTTNLLRMIDLDVNVNLIQQHKA